jgi:sortase A
VKTLLRGSRWWFLTVGLALLGYVTFVVLGGAFFQSYESWKFEQTANAASPQSASSISSTSAAGSGSSEVDRVILAPGTIVGRLVITRIRLNVMVVEGTDDKNLNRAAGHVIGTALPGESGNIAISGHRDTFFRPLRNLRKNDDILLEAAAATFRYRVESMTVMTPEDTEVLSGTSDDTLTLITCYPFDFVGSAPNRFIIRAKRM